MKFAEPNGVSSPEIITLDSTNIVSYRRYLQVFFWPLLASPLVQCVNAEQENLNHDKHKDQEAHSRPVGSYDYSER